MKLRQIASTAFFNAGKTQNFLGAVQIAQRIDATNQLAPTMAQEKTVGVLRTLAAPLHTNAHNNKKELIPTEKSILGELEKERDILQQVINELGPEHAKHTNKEAVSQILKFMTCCNPAPLPEEILRKSFIESFSQKDYHNDFGKILVAGYSSAALASVAFYQAMMPSDDEILFILYPAGSIAALLLTAIFYKQVFSRKETAASKLFEHLLTALLSHEVLSRNQDGHLFINHSKKTLPLPIFEKSMRDGTVFWSEDACYCNEKTYYSLKLMRYINQHYEHKQINDAPQALSLNQLLDLHEIIVEEMNLLGTNNPEKDTGEIKHTTSEISTFLKNYDEILSRVYRRAFQ